MVLMEKTRFGGFLVLRGSASSGNFTLPEWTSNSVNPEVRRSDVEDKIAKALIIKNKSIRARGQPKLS